MAVRVSRGLYKLFFANWSGRVDDYGTWRSSKEGRNASGVGMTAIQFERA